MSSWDPPSPRASRLDVFRRHVNRKYGLFLQTYAQLHQWSVAELEAFSIEMWEFLGIVASESPSKPANRLDVLWPRPEWFPEARINYTENLLAVGLATHPDAIAVSAGREGAEGPAAWRHLTWRQLQMQVALYATAFRKAGIVHGDRIAAVSSNSLEAVLLLLAAGAVGAIFSSTAPDMGASGIVERYSQIRPKLLFVDCAVTYGGKAINLGAKMREVTQTIQAKDSELQKIIVMSGDTWDDPMVTTLSSFINVAPEPLEYVQVPFDYPIYILYTSGTTGPPKCICHAGGGVLLQGKKDFILHFNMGPESTYYQYTTTGWMMWNYLVGALSVGARIVLYDGSPLYPTPTHQVQLLREQGVTHWGTSPKFLSALRKAGLGDVKDLDDLECVISAGSALAKDLCTWFEKRFPERVGLFNGSGGTDCMSGIVGCNPLSTIHYGEIAWANLGLDVQVWDANGKNIDNTGQGGELVITKPFFSMPITFWGPDGMEKYRKAYFDVFPGIWCHGDFVRKNPTTGGFVMLGRSDGVLNPGGIRFGAAELYGVVEGFPEVLDCIACGQRRPGDTDERVLLFLKMRNGSNLDETVRSRVRNAIRKQLSARHVPSHILEVADVPCTLNGKRIEHVVSDVVNGRKPRALGSSIANPGCIKEYEKYVDLDKRIAVNKL